MTDEKSERRIWFNGEIVPWNDAHVHVMTHTIHYGVAAFEGIRAYKRANGKSYVFRLREHVDRLFESCKLVMMEPKVGHEQVTQACLDVVRANRLEDAYLRPVVFVGEGAPGIYAPNNPVHAFVATWKLTNYLGEEALKKGIRAKVSSYSRYSLGSSFPRGKISGQYVNNVLAKREAKLGGYDEAILLDGNGNVSEGCGENVFLVKKGVLYTPDESSSILAGITRDTVLQLASELGITVKEGRITRDQLLLADEVFLTGTAAEITPVREVDDRAIGRGGVGPITRALQERFFDVVRGSSADHPEWLAEI